MTPKHSPPCGSSPIKQGQGDPQEQISSIVPSRSYPVPAVSVASYSLRGSVIAIPPCGLSLIAAWERRLLQTSRQPCRGCYRKTCRRSELEGMVGHRQVQAQGRAHGFCATTDAELAVDIARAALHCAGCDAEGAGDGFVG